jgi:hypothetical protein
MTYFPLTTWDWEQTKSFGYYDDFYKIPTHKVIAVPDDSKLLGIHQFVVYGNPLPRDYGQINGQYTRTAEPLKLAFVENDWDWQTAVANWFESDLFVHQPWGLQELIRKPRTRGNRNFRLHYARFLLPLTSSWRSQPYYDKRMSPSFTAYYIGQGEDRRFINEFIVDAAFRADPISWNAGGRRAYTIPQDWLTNRIDENASKYDLFA